MLKSQVMPQPLLESVRPKARRGPRAARRATVFAAGAAVVALSAVTQVAAAAAPPKFEIREGQTVSYPVGADQIKAYFSRPIPVNAYPGVVVIHEWWGLNDQIKGVADRLAAEGYLAIVPDLYRGKVPTDAGYAHDLMRGVNENWAVTVIEGAATWLRATDAKERRRTPGQRMPVATLGFCFGGRLSLATALKGADIQAMAMFYGGVETDPKVLEPISVPVLGIFGNEDRGIPLDQVKAFESALKAAGKKATILVYTGVGHAFFNEERPGYDPDVSIDAWERTTMFLRESLGRPAVGARPLAPAPPAPPKPTTDEP
jgi:carboxymethylenebutenolidase